jgi:hypothetical protein
MSCGRPYARIAEVMLRGNSRRAVEISDFGNRGTTCVCLLDKKKPKGYVEIGVDAEDYYRIKDSKEER